MIWRDELQSWSVAFFLAGVVYIFGGYLFRSLHPTGMLNWQGRRWRKGITFLILLNAGVFDVRFNLESGRIGFGIAVTLWLVLGLLTILLLAWWWQDARKEKAAQEALVEKLHNEGRELVAPPMSTGKKAWRWAVNGYALFLVAAGLYALVHYLLKRF